MMKHSFSYLIYSLIGAVGIGAPRFTDFLTGDKALILSESQYPPLYERIIVIHTQGKLSLCLLYLLVQSLILVPHFATPWTVAHQSPLSMGFPRQEYWSGLAFPPPGNLLHPGIKPASLAQQVNSIPLSHLGNPPHSLAPRQNHTFPVLPVSLALCLPFPVNPDSILICFLSHFTNKIVLIQMNNNLRTFK